jgi:hypothetical protein
MEGLLTPLLFAALFSFMMRFGCGAHAVHGHGAHHEAAGTTEANPDQYASTHRADGGTR